MTIRLTTLGAARLSDGGAEVLASRRKLVAMVAYLERHSPRPVSRESLAAMFWGSRDSAHARQSLRQALVELRAALGAGLIADERAVRVRIASDVAEFLAMGQSTADHETAAGLWSGDYLAGLDDAGDGDWRAWLEGERAQLNARMGAVFAALITMHERRGDGPPAVAIAERWVLLRPADTTAWINLVKVLRWSGRNTEADARLAEGLHRLRALAGDEGARDLELLARPDGGAPPPAGPGARALLAPDFVGRDNILARTLTLLAGVSEGKGAAIIIEGDARAGKTRTASEFSRQARAQPGVVVIEERAFSAERDRPWATLRPLVLALAEAPGVMGAPPDALGALAAIAPALRERIPSLAMAPASTTIDATVIGDAFARCAADVAGEQPLVLVVDDAPEGDPASLGVLASLARRPPPGALVVLTGRVDAWREAMDSNGALAGVERLTLEALSPPEMTRLVASVLPFDVRAVEQVSAALHRIGGGMPGNAVLMLRDLVDRGVLLPGPGGRWVLTGDIEPGTFRASEIQRDDLQALLARLTPDARQLLDAAAVVGPRVDEALAERVSGLGPTPFRAAVTELLGSRILRVGAQGEGSLEFASGGWRDTNYTAIAPSRRRELHERAWRALGGPRASTPMREAAALHARLGRPPTRWTRPAFQVAAVAIGLVVLAGAFTAWRGRRGAVPAGSTVLLADVENLTPDSLMGRAIHTAAGIALQQSRRVFVFPRVRINETLQLMRKPADAALTDALAREVAVREDIPRVVVVQVAQLGSAYQLNVRLTEPRSGRDLFGASRTVADANGVLPALDALLLDVRRAVGESPDSISANSAPLPRVTTASLAALQVFARGQREYTRQNFEGARQAFLDAVRLDSGFAMAWVALASDASYRGNDPANTERLLATALTLEHTLTERERLRLRALAYRHRGQSTEGLRLARQLAERYPDRDNIYNLASDLMRARQCDEAVPIFRRVIAIDSTLAGAHLNLATCLQLQGDYADALVAYAGATRADSNALYRGNINQEWGHAFVRLGRLADAERVFLGMAARPDEADRARGYRSLGYLRMLQGRYADANTALDSAVALSRRPHPTSLAVMRNLMIRSRIEHTSGRDDAARASVNEAATIGRSLSVEAFFWFVLGEMGARTRVSSAMKLAHDRAVSATAPRPIDADRQKLLLARLDIVKRQPRRAIERVQGVVDTSTGPWKQLIRADAYEMLGFRDSAIAELRMVGAVPRFGDEIVDEQLRAPYRIGRLLDAMGDSAGAVTAYRAYLQRWPDADAFLPEVQRARARLTALEAVRAKVAETRPRS